jgi:hypothetical protein
MACGIGVVDTAFASVLGRAVSESGLRSHTGKAVKSSVVLDLIFLVADTVRRQDRQTQPWQKDAGGM